MQIKSSMIHPELRKAGEFIRLVLPCFTERKFRMAKVAIDRLKGKVRRGMKYEQVYISREDGSQLRLCIYSPLSHRECIPGMLWLHGGGYAMGVPELDVLFIERFVKSSGCVVVSPDYRLSIEAPYPAALEDGYAALLWLKSHGSEYGMRDDQIFVGGDSAGGGLAAAVSLYARDKGEVAIAFQIPLYPMLDDRMTTPSSVGNDAPLWNSRSNEIAWKLYLRDLYGTENVPAYAAPARCGELAGLPPACSFVGSIEMFRDETVEYLERLRAAGTPVHYKVFDGCFHGFDIVCAKTQVAKEAVSFITACYKYAVENYFAAQP